MDYRGLLIPRLALINPSSAINLHANRQANERQGEADLIGAGELPGDDWFFISIGKVGFSTSYVFNIYQHGDQTALYDAVPDDGDIIGFQECPDFQQSTFSTDTEFDPDPLDACGIFDTPDGYTETIYDKGLGATTDDPPSSPEIDVRAVSDGAVIQFFTGLTLCDMFIQSIPLDASARGYKRT